MTNPALDVSIEIDTTNGDHEKFAHYADKDEVTESLVFGYPVVALCGKVWVPSRAPDKFPICPVCKEIYDLMPN